MNYLPLLNHIGPIKLSQTPLTRHFHILNISRHLTEGLETYARGETPKSFQWIFQWVQNKMAADSVNDCNGCPIYKQLAESQSTLTKELYL